MVEYGEQLEFINIKHKTMEQQTTTTLAQTQKGTNEIDPNAANIVDSRKKTSVNDLE